MQRIEKFNLRHETKRNVFFRFLSLTAIVAGYFLWMTWRFGAKSGLEVTVLSWSFFVFCTPIADAGFLVAFPIRILLGVRMLVSQSWVFFIAFFLDAGYFFWNRSVFAKTWLLRLFEKIIENPFPYWGIILLSVAGTFLSIYFGDELFDTVKHEQRVKFQKHRLKHRLIIVTFLFVATVLLYKTLIQNLGVEINL